MNAEPKIPAPERSGPVDELKKRFTSEPRASASARVESAIEAHFRRPEVPAGLLESVLCRTTVCRVKTRWSPERAQGFLSATMLLVTEPAGDQAGFDPNVGISPEADPAPDGSRAIDVYVLLSAAEPSEPAP
jgi:hypothetical protein